MILDNNTVVPVLNRKKYGMLLTCRSYNIIIRFPKHLVKHYRAGKLKSVFYQKTFLRGFSRAGITVGVVSSDRSDANSSSRKSADNRQGHQELFSHIKYRYIGRLKMR